MKKIRFLALLLVVAALMTGCGSDGSTSETGASDNNISQTEPPTSETQPTETDAPAEFVTLFSKNGKNDFTIIEGKHNNANGLNLFASALMQKIGHNIKIRESSTEVSENEILIGYVNNREESVSTYADIPSYEYYVGFVNGKLVIAAYTSTGLQLALDYVAAYITKNDNGDYGFMSDLKQTGRGIRVDFDVPKVVTKRGYVLDGAASNSMMHLAYKNVTSEEVANYGTLLKEKGYTEHSTNSISDNKFATYYNNELEVHTMYFPQLKDFRVVFGKKGYIPSTQAPEFTRLNDVSLTQNVFSQNDSGMSYMLKLADGSFIIIDGGRNFSGYDKALWNYLNTNKPASDSKPRVTWMFTHAHSDHMQLAINFLINYKDKIDLQMVCYNFPDTNAMPYKGTGLSPYIKDLKSTLKNYYSKTEIFVYHSGQKLLLPSVDIEFLATQEDYWPLEFTNENLTSNVWRMTFEDGRTMLVVGDLEITGSERLTTIYSTELESDIFQVNHHGYSGFTQKLIDYVDPKICLWSSIRAKFEDNSAITGSANNAQLKAYLKNTKWTRADGTSGDRLHYHGEAKFNIVFKSAT